MNYIKGTLTKCKYDEKYDNEGDAYKDYVLIVDNQKYTAQIKERIYLQEGMKLILSTDADNKVISGYCINEDYGWGANAKNLKSKIDSTEKYTFLEGTVTEKRKSNTGSINMAKDGMENAGTKISYTIFLGNIDFHASADEGKYLKIGMNIATVLEKNTPVIILDKEANKYLGLTKPYFIVFLGLIIAFNVFMHYTTLIPEKNIKVTQITLNIFLALATLLNIITYMKTSKAKEFLVSNMKA